MIAKKRDHELCRFMELLNKCLMKLNSKLLTAEPPDMKVLCALWYKVHVRDVILYRTGKEVNDEWRLVIPREKRTDILSLLHDSKMAAHPGMSKMKLTIGSRFYWPHMRQDIENWIKCIMAKRGFRQQQHPLQQELNGEPFDHVAFDVIGPLPITGNGNRFILIMIDYYSKWAEMIVS